MSARTTAVIAVVRRILGMPDYAAYCAHLRAAHPTCTLPSEREYFEAYLKDRYDSGPTRCC